MFIVSFLHTTEIYRRWQKASCLFHGAALGSGRGECGLNGSRGAPEHSKTKHCNFAPIILLECCIDEQPNCNHSGIFDLTSTRNQAHPFANGCVSGRDDGNTASCNVARSPVGKRSFLRLIKALPMAGRFRFSSIHQRLNCSRRHSTFASTFGLPFACADERQQNKK
eukprot:TRINITY_DN31697_c0_g1_i1.p1 TRINITY_DN31697_c0_g1~~TRINITY_DN31697_c0_g1_i1.p1  ORF type:complete len:167 (-),score=14.64 TRINITY_DN31697_c0_g1_i1:732-1232(-)